jgi:hypothetical protein
VRLDALLNNKVAVSSRERTSQVYLDKLRTAMKNASEGEKTLHILDVSLLVWQSLLDRWKQSAVGGVAGWGSRARRWCVSKQFVFCQR